MPTTALPATSTPPEPESDGGSASGAVSSEYVGSGVMGMAGGALDASAESDGDRLGVAADSAARRVAEGEGASALAPGCVGSAALDAPEGSSEFGAGSGAAVSLEVGLGERVGLGDFVGVGDMVGWGVGVGSATTSAHPRAG